MTNAHAIKAAVSLLCCFSCNSSKHCDTLLRAGMADLLVHLLREGSNDIRAYAGQVLVDIAIHKPTLRKIIIPIFCSLPRMIDWFDVSRGLGILAWRCKNIEQGSVDMMVGPLIEALLNPIGFTSRNAENCIVMGIGCIGSNQETIVIVVERLVAALEVSAFGTVKTLIVRALAIVLRKIHGKYLGLVGINTALMSHMIKSLVPLFEQGCKQAQKYSADCLGCIANELHYIDLVAASGAMGYLVSIMQLDYINDIKQYAAMAIGNIGCIAEHAHTMMGMGVIEPLLQLLKVDCDLDGGEFAAMAVSNMAFNSECADAMIDMGVVEQLAQLACNGLMSGLPTTKEAKIRKWRMNFTRAWAVIAMLSISGRRKHHNNHLINSALELVVVQLPGCSIDMRLELARALLETVEKQEGKRHLLRTPMTAVLLDELSSKGSDNTVKHAKDARRKLTIN